VIQLKLRCFFIQISGTIIDSLLAVERETAMAKNTLAIDGTLSRWERHQNYHISKQIQQPKQWRVKTLLLWLLVVKIVA